MKLSTEAINLLRARLCLDCEPGTIHHADACPVCGSRAWHYLGEWITPNTKKSYLIFGEPETCAQ